MQRFRIRNKSTGKIVISNFSTRGLAQYRIKEGTSGYYTRDMWPGGAANYKVEPYEAPQRAAVQ